MVIKGVNMKRLHGIYETPEQANSIVRSLMADGISAYRQGLKVYTDDGGVDEAL